MGRKKKDDGLNPKEKAVVRDYVGSPDPKVRGNATESAAKNGVGETRMSSAVLGNRIVKSEAAKEIIERIDTAAEEKAVFNRVKVLEELKRMVHYDPRMLAKDGSILSLDSLPEEIARCVVGVKMSERTDEDGYTTKTWDYRLADKLGACEKAMRFMSMFKNDAADRIAESLEALVSGSWKKPE